VGLLEEEESHLAGESGHSCAASCSRDRGAGGAPNVPEKRAGQGRKGDGEGRDRMRDFHVPWGCGTLCCLPPYPGAVSLLPALPAPLSPSSLLRQAKESIEQLVYLCQTDKEPVREAAKQSLMLCGECPAAPLCSIPPTASRAASPGAGSARRRRGSWAGPCLPRKLWLIVPQALPGKSKLAAGSDGQASCGYRALSPLVIYYLLDGPERTI